jgi:peroxisomal 3,2-trans-enoyl-CoA isomerase
MSRVKVDIADGIATITFDRPQSLNAITAGDYDAFRDALLEIDKRQDVLVSPFHLWETGRWCNLIHCLQATVWQATGRWFCSCGLFRTSAWRSKNGGC